MEVIQIDRLPWVKPTYLVPIGDIQYGAAGIDLVQLRADVQRGVDHGAWFVGLGDYLDVASPSGRAKIKKADFYDSVSSALDAEVSRQLDGVMEILEPTRGRWWGVLQGHHYYDFEDGTTTDTRLAQYLDCPFLGDSAFIHARFNRSSTAVQGYSIFATHGHGSGQTQAAPLSKLERFAGGIRADLYLINHYARRGAVPADVLELSPKGHLIDKTVHYVATGGYMKGYMAGSSKDGRAQGSYVEKAMMKPTTMGGALIKFIPTQQQGKLSIKTEVTV